MPVANVQLKLSIRFNPGVTHDSRVALQAKAEGMFPGADDHTKFVTFEHEVDGDGQPVDGAGKVISRRDVVLTQAPDNVTANHDGAQYATSTALSDDFTVTYYEVNGIWYCEYCFDLEDLTEGGEGGTVHLCIVFPM